MNRGNLIPAARRAKQVQRRLLRRWSVISACYLGLLVIASLLVNHLWVVQQVDAAAAAHVRTEISSDTTKLASQRAQTIALRRESELGQEVSDQPDWSILLAAIAKRCGDEVVMTSCRLSPGADRGRDSASIVLWIQGIGWSEDSIAAFILKLGEVPVLQQVKLLQTSRKKLGDVDAYSFEVTCSVADRKAPHE